MIVHEDGGLAPRNGQGRFDFLAIQRLLEETDHLIDLRSHVLLLMSIRHQRLIIVLEFV